MPCYIQPLQFKVKVSRGNRQIFEQALANLNIKFVVKADGRSYHLTGKMESANVVFDEGSDELTVRDGSRRMMGRIEQEYARILIEREAGDYGWVMSDEGVRGGERTMRYIPYPGAEQVTELALDEQGYVTASIVAGPRDTCSTVSQQVEKSVGLGQGHTHPQVGQSLNIGRKS